MTRTKHVINLPNGASDAVPSLLAESGFVKTMVVITPNFTAGGTTVVITIDDPDGYTVYTSNALGESLESLGTGLNIPIGHGFKAIATPNQDPTGSGGDVTIVLYISETNIR